jgi:hypothetical protein
MEDEHLNTLKDNIKILKKDEKDFRNKGIFDRIKSFFPFFVVKESKDAKLVGRIRNELQKDAKEILNKLKSLKESLRAELESHYESQLWSSIEAVVNPLLREYNQIEKKLMDQSTSIETHTTAIKSYNEWIVKAKLWVTLCNLANDRQDIVHAVVIHTKQVLNDIIDRDLKTLHDYKLHEVRNIGLNFQEIEAVSSTIGNKIKPHVEELEALKKHNPKDIKFDHLMKWKAEVNALRANHYEAALHIIDSIIQSVSPEPIQDDALDHLKEVFERLAYLEEELPIFLGHLKRVDLKEDVTKQMLEGQLMFLEEEIHKVNRDLRLTPELADRAAFIIQELNQAHSYFTV